MSEFLDGIFFVIRLLAWAGGVAFALGIAWGAFDYVENIFRRGLIP